MHIIVNHLRLRSRLALLIVVGVWCLMVILLVDCFNSTFLSFMSVKKMGAVINSLEELALTNGTQLVIQGSVNRFLVYLSKQSELIL